MHPLRIALVLGLLLPTLAHAQKKLSFQVRQLHLDNNEGCAVADFDGDGDLDVSAGEFWYSNPDFKPHRIRTLGTFGADYLENNGEHVMDVDGDGLVDIVSGSFRPTVVNWYKNPGSPDAEAWEEHLLVETEQTCNEATFLEDLDGDGKPEWIANSWKDNNAFLAWRLEGIGGEGATARPHTIGEPNEISNGHGAGFGDIDGDGRVDVVFKNGWYRQPEGGAFSGPWELRPDFTLPHASCPILVLDLNGDGRSDIIWGDGHNYGLYWEEQRAPDADGTTNWRQHLIDKSFSQPHALAWEDIDRDGQPELITGKRVRAHSGKDPGGDETPVIHYYDWLPESKAFRRHVIHTGKAGIGLQIRVADLDANGWPDIICAGKSGTHILFNQGFSKPAK